MRELKSYIVLVFLTIVLLGVQAFPVFGQLTNSTAASPTISVTTDKSSYTIGDTVKISGQVSKQVNVPYSNYLPEQINLLISGPSGLQYPVTLYPDAHLQFEEDLKMGKTLGFVDGTYKISAQYAGATSVMDFSLNEPVFIPPPPIAATTISISTDKSTYLIGQTIILNGNVSKVIPYVPVTYKVLDPNGTKIFDGAIYPNSQGIFSSQNSFQQGTTSGLLIDSVNPLYGVYQVVATYGNATTSTQFTLAQKIQQTIPILVTTDKQAYGLGDTVSITGSTKLLGVPSLNLMILQSFSTGTVPQVFVQKSFVNIASDGTFSYQLNIPNTATRYGDYRVIVSSSLIGSAEADFSVVANPSTYVKTQTGKLSIVTDQPSYNLGDKFTISGNIPSNVVQPGVSLAINVTNANGTALTSSANPQINGLAAGGAAKTSLSFYAYPDSNGNYQTQQTLYPSIFSKGTYILIAKYNTLIASTSFAVSDSHNLNGTTIIASTDKQIYGAGDQVNLTGQVSSSTTASSSYSLILTKPDSSIARYSLPIANGHFSWNYNLSSPVLYGIYRVTISSDTVHTAVFFEVSQNPQLQTAISPFLLQTDKTDYQTTETAVVSGQVVQQINHATVEQNTMPQISIFNVQGQEIERIFANIDPSGHFQASVKLRPGIYQTGEYKVYGNYLGSTIITSFKVTDIFTTSSEKLSLLITTDKDQYLPGDTVLITGRTSYIISISSVDITVAKTGSWEITEGEVKSIAGNVLPKVTVPFDQTSSFSYNYQIPKSADAGNYTIVAQVPYGAYITPFEVVAQLPAIQTQQNVTTQTNATVTNTTQTMQPSSVPNSIGPIERPSTLPTVTDKVNRITDSIISIPIKEKNIGNKTLLPRILDGLLRVNPGDESNVNIKLTMSDGTCLIGQTSDCKITSSTISSSSLYQQIKIGNENFMVGYTGTNTRLEKFTIFPIDVNGTIPDGQWNVQIVKDQQPSRFYYQITYQSTQ